MSHSSIRFGIGRFMAEAEIVVKTVKGKVEFLRELSPGAGRD
jgi:hypothetical protein